MDIIVLVFLVIIIYGKKHIEIFYLTKKYFISI
jgi:hypothetical protein